MTSGRRIGGKKEREREKEFIPKIAATAGAGVGQSQKPTTTSRCPMLVARDEAPEPSSTPFPAGSWVGSRVART